MTLFEFSVYLDRQPTDEEQDALYEAGFDDSVVEVTQGRGIIHVARESDSLVEVILSAFNQAKHAGFDIVGIDDEDLVTLKTIASRVGRTYESMRLLASGQRGPGDFPPRCHRTALRSTHGAQLPSGSKHSWMKDDKLRSRSAPWLPQIICCELVHLFPIWRNSLG